MKHTTILLIISTLIGFTSKAQHLEKTKAKYDYHLYLPQDYQQNNKKYPLLIYLHGSSQRGDDLNKLKGYGIPRAVAQGQHFDFIAVSPQCPSNKYWFSEDWFSVLYAELQSKYRIDPSRIYLTGVSMGGGGVFEVAKDYPNTFAALVPLCAWLSGTDRLCTLKNIPIWTFHGTEDEVVPISETDSKVKTLEKCQGRITYTKLENEGHGIHWLYEKRDVYDIYKWMLQFKK